MISIETMKYKATTIYILIIFLSITLFGFLGMSVMDHGIHGACPFSPAGSSPCPEEGEIAVALHHVGSLEGFSEAVFSASILSALLFTVLAAVFHVRNSVKLKQNILKYNLPVKKYKKLHEEVFNYVLLVFNWLRHTQKLNPEATNSRRMVLCLQKV